MEYIEEMVFWDVRAMRTDRMKIVIQEAAGLGERKGKENITIKNQRSGEDYIRKVLDFLEGAREEKRREEKEVNKKTKWNGSAEVCILPSKRERRNSEEQRKGRRKNGRIISPNGINGNTRRQIE